LTEFKQYNIKILRLDAEIPKDNHSN